MRRTFLVVLLGVLLALLAGGAIQPAVAQESGTGAGTNLSNADEVEAFVDGTMTTQLESHDVPGATVAVVKDGEVVLAKGYGYADAESRTPVRANETMFRVGSVSKLVTYTTVMQEVERGRLDPDRDVNAYLQESPVEIPARYDEPVTLTHLGTHTAGFEDVYTGLFYDDPSHLRPLGEALAANQPARVRPPGELAAYSNWGAALSGHVVAERANTSYPAYAEANVFEPLGMSASTFRQPVPDDVDGTMATGHRYRDGEFQPRGFEYVGIPPAGSMSATATDMSRFMIAHLQNGSYGDERILNESTAVRMHSRQFTHDPQLNGMAYGFVEMDRNGERVIGHGGATERFHTQLILLPEHDVGVFVSYNAPGGGAAGPEFVDAFMDQYYPVEEQAPPDRPDGAADRAAELTGEYRSTRMPYTSWWKFAGLGQTVTVSHAGDGELVTVVPGGEQFGVGPTRWVEVEPNRYREVAGDNRMAFRVDENGRVTHLFMGSNPTAAFERLAWYETSWATLLAFGGALALFLLSGLLWLVLAGYRWRTGRPRWSRRTWAARGVAVGVGLGLLALVAALSSAAQDPFAVLVGGSLAGLFVSTVPYLLLLLVVAVVGFAGLAWRDGQWSPLVRAHYTLLAVASLVVLWELWYWQFLPP